MSAKCAPRNHPSEGRTVVRLGVLIYGLVAAPSAWIMAQIVCSGLASRACHPKYEPLATPAFSGTPVAHAGVLLLAATVCASSALVAFNAWKRTRNEHKGDGQMLLEVGEGRSRFMALTGVLTSLGFLLAVAFSVAAAIFVPLC